MKRFILILIVTLYLLSCSRQPTRISDYATQHDIFPPNIVTLKDSGLNYIFILDSSHIYVTAQDSNGNIIWKTDPFIDNGFEDARTRRPIIVRMYFGKSHEGDPMKRHKVLWIYYHNEAGYLELATGKYREDKGW